MSPGRLHPFSPRKQKTPFRLELAFRLVQRFVSKVDQRLAWTKLKVNCPEIILFRKYNAGKQGQRAFMHVEHLKNTVCALSLSSQLSEEYLFGLLLHEFGHLGSGGGEREADQWVLDHFGIWIRYLGDLDLEWVDRFTILRIVRAATPLRRNPRRRKDPARLRR